METSYRKESIHAKPQETNMKIEKEEEYSIGSESEATEKLDSSEELNSEEVINQFKKKLDSVKQLNQQHETLIKNLNTKFGNFQSVKRNESPKVKKVVKGKQALDNGNNSYREKF